MKEKKFVFVDNGQPCNLGDNIYSINHEGMIIIVEITEENRNELIKHGVVKEVPQELEKSKNESKKTFVNLDLNTVVEKICKATGWKPLKAANILDKITDINSAVILSLSLKIIAVEMDKKYKDHISKSPEIFVFSLFDGKIHKADKSKIKNYRNFAAFRTLEDAQFACNIFRDQINEMFF